MRTTQKCLLFEYSVSELILLNIKSCRVKITLANRRFISTKYKARLSNINSVFEQLQETCGQPHPVPQSHPFRNASNVVPLCRILCENMSNGGAIYFSCHRLWTEAPLNNSQQAPKDKLARNYGLLSPIKLAHSSEYLACLK